MIYIVSDGKPVGDWKYFVQPIYMIETTESWGASNWGVQWQEYSYGVGPDWHHLHIVEAS